MTAQAEKRLSPEEYLALERRAEEKSEYLDGETFAMAGASYRHNAITINLTLALGPRVKDCGCRLFGSDMRIHVPATGLYTYPDLAAVCDEPRFADAELDVLLNPALIVEVLSKSTEAYDRGKKFEHYRTVESLREYLLVSQDRPHVDRYLRRDDGTWLLGEAKSTEDELTLESVGCVLPIREIYAEVPNLIA